MSIHETSLLRSTHWPAPHWCCGEYNIPRLLIARSCWTCPHELSRLRIAGLSVGITGVGIVRDGQVRLVPITIGHDYGDTVEVATGLTRQDLVVLNPPDSLVSGTRVEIPPNWGPGPDE
jgi:hypothetical protein